MSEAATVDTPPLSPDSAPEPQEQPVETQAEATETEAPAAPDYSKLIQREQMERANLSKTMQKRLDSIETLLQGIASQPRAQQADDLDEVDKHAESLESILPGSGAALKKLAQEARANRGFRGELDSLKKETAKQREFDDFMSQYPAPVKTAFSARQQELIAELKESGIEADESQVSIAMGQWLKAELKRREAAAPADPKKAATSGRILPKTGAARQEPKSTYQKLRDGIGGNLLGIKMKDYRAI